MAKAQDRALIRRSHDALIQVSKLLVQMNVVQGLFHGRVRVTKQLLQQLDAQHHLGGKRRLTCLALGGCGEIKASSSVQGITSFISSRNSRLRVRLVTSSNPVWARLICFMAQMSQIRPLVGFLLQTLLRKADYFLDKHRR
jgi:hypothetical protein